MLEQGKCPLGDCSSDAVVIVYDDLPDTSLALPVLNESDVASAVSDRPKGVIEGHINIVQHYSRVS